MPYFGLGPPFKRYCTVTEVMNRLVVLEFLGHFVGRFGKLSAAGKVGVLPTTYAPLSWVPGWKPKPRKTVSAFTF